MSMPGFTAENSLQPSSFSYNGGQSFSMHGDETVQPEFLGFIKEAFESVGDQLSKAASAVGDMFTKLRDTGGPGGRPFVCGQWVVSVLACKNGGPAYNQAEVLMRCMSSNPEQTVACAAASAALYPLVGQACRENPNGIGSLLGQVCR